MKKSFFIKLLLTLCILFVLGLLLSNYLMDAGGATEITNKGGSSKLGASLMSDSALMAKSDKGEENQPRIYLGVNTRPIKSPTSSVLGLHKGVGLALTYVANGSSASLAGLKPLDIIYRIDNQVLVNEEQLITLLKTYQINDSVILSYFRGGEAQRVKVTFTNSVKLSHSQTDSLISSSVKTSEGTYHLKYIKGKITLEIVNSSGGVLFKGIIANEKDLVGVPYEMPKDVMKKWKEMVQIKKMLKIKTNITK